MIARKILLSVLFISTPFAARAGVWDVYDGPSGVSCTRFNHPTGVTWKNAGFDWVDASGVAQGSKPFSSQSVRLNQTGTVRFDVPKALLAAPAIILRHAPTSLRGTVNFHARESTTGVGPRLLITTSDNRVVTLQAKADASSSRTGEKCTSIVPMGMQPTLNLGYGALISFGAIPSGAVSAVMELQISRAYNAATLGLYAMVSPIKPESPLTTGLSSKYPKDAGIQFDPNVLYFEGWDDQPDDWWRRAGGSPVKTRLWTADGGRFNYTWSGVRLDQTGGVNGGAGLKVVFQANSTGGTGVPTVDLVKLKGKEYDELFLRYYIKFGPDFRDAPLACDGGKIPGFASDTSLGASSGVPARGDNGWSLRGSYRLNCDAKNPIYPSIVLSTYAYHADMKGWYGDIWQWPTYGELGLATLGKWVCVEQQLKVNTPGLRDGVLRTWIDGKLAWEKTALYLRAKPPYLVPGNLGIQKLWGTLHHGGTVPLGRQATVWYDQTVVATRRIGCQK